MPGVTDLYSDDILTLAQSLRDEALAAPDATVRRVSKLCGSEVELDLTLIDRVVTGFAQRVRACALGQASAAILKATVKGATCAELTSARDALHAMLKSDGPPPEGRFAALSRLKGVRDYPARHQSVLLPWEAAAEACREACLQPPD